MSRRTGIDRTIAEAHPDHAAPSARASPQSRWSGSPFGIFLADVRKNCRRQLRLAQKNRWKSGIYNQDDHLRERSHPENSTYRRNHLDGWAMERDRRLRSCRQRSRRNGRDPILRARQLFEMRVATQWFALSSAHVVAPTDPTGLRAAAARMNSPEAHQGPSILDNDQQKQWD